MSSQIALVLFPGGRVLAGRYQGTADVVAGELCPVDGNYDALDWPADPSPEDHPDAVPVIVWSSYAYGFWWPGRAIYDRMELVAGHDPFASPLLRDGVPGWVDDVFGAMP